MHVFVIDKCFGLAYIKRQISSIIFQVRYYVEATASDNHAGNYCFLNH